MKIYVIVEHYTPNWSYSIETVVGAWTDKEAAHEEHNRLNRLPQKPSTDGYSTHHYSIHAIESDTPYGGDK